MTRQEAQMVWDAAWEACLEIQVLRERLEHDEEFAADPKSWCFDTWAYANGYPPPPVITVATATGTQERHWNAETQAYE